MTRYTHRDIISFWLSYNQGDERRAYRRKSGNMRYEGDTIFYQDRSFARHLKAFILVDDLYGHANDGKAQVEEWADVPVFHVKHLGYVEDLHEGNQRYLGAKLTGAKRRYVNAIAYGPEGIRKTHYYREVIKAHHEYVKHADAIGRPEMAKGEPPIDRVLADLELKRQARERLFNSPRQIEKRQRAAARREAKKAFGLEK
jgi:hypothetical protein